MKVVVDTNVMLVSFSRKSKYHLIFKAFVEEKYTLCVTTAILIEYEEIFGRHMGVNVAENFMSFLEMGSNVEFVSSYFKWNLIHADPDDNKFVDCAVASSATCIVSNDNHFNELKNLEFPSIQVMDADSFLAYLHQSIN